MFSFVCSLLVLKKSSNVADAEINRRGHSSGDTADRPSLVYALADLTRTDDSYFQLVTVICEDAGLPQ